jgi:alkanesulfonate monooxygenase SsuD/methylene tetrahydromethanopterin reductase-like flavin-dependent oxidoreductase (luciferase family)
MDIGKIGVWTSYRPFGAERAGEAAKLVEQLGYSAWWVGGSPHVPDVRPVLDATSSLIAATALPVLAGGFAVPDPDAEHEAAGLRNYVQNVLDVGFGEDDVANGGSDRLIDAIVPHGSVEQIAETVHAHLDAGADHVCLQPLGEDGIPRKGWTEIARALL